MSGASVAPAKGFIVGDSASRVRWSPNTICIRPRHMRAPRDEYRAQVTAGAERQS